MVNIFRTTFMNKPYDPTPSPDIDLQNTCCNVIKNAALVFKMKLSNI